MSHVEDYLMEFLPPSGTVDFDEWTSRWRSLLTESDIPRLVEALRTGTDNEQYVAFNALRMFFGYDMYMSDPDGDRTYRVRAPDAVSATEIRPLIKPTSINLDD
jgi:hypothetical protein